jgi:hypothetical protein
MSTFNPDWQVRSSNISGHFNSICLNAFYYDGDFHYTYCHEVLCSVNYFRPKNDIQTYWVKYLVNVDLLDIIKKFYYLFDLTTEHHKLIAPVLVSDTSNNAIIIKLDSKSYDTMKHRLFVMKLLRFAYVFNYETFGQLVINHLYYKTNFIKDTLDFAYNDDTNNILYNPIGWANYFFDRQPNPRYEGFISFANKTHENGTLYSSIWNATKGSLQL